MDHLILPPNTDPYITVPFKCIVPYEAGNFMRYPQIHNWTEEHLYEDEDFGGRPTSDVEAFFQTWLFFGMALEVLKAAGVQATMEDFIDRGPQVVVTTKKLPGMLRDWKESWGVSDISAECYCCFWMDDPRPSCDKEPCLKKRVKSSDVESMRNALAILEKVRSTLCHFCGTSEKHRALERWATTRSEKSWPGAAEILLSISALGHTLYAAVQDIYSPQSSINRWPGELLMVDRLLKAKWCLKHICMTMSDFQIDGRYYIAANPDTEKTDQDHSACEETGCLATGLSEKSYVTRHAVTECNCEHQVSPVANMLGIIDRGGTPILTWAKQGNDDNPEYGLNLTEFRLSLPQMPTVQYDANQQPIIETLTAKYVAISHVWSDGLGNPTQNSIPACQSTQIQQMVNQLYPERKPGENIPFWMDTLCIPVHKKYKKFRKLCIVNMRNIYEQADIVLVIDSGMRTVSLSAPAAERCVRLHQSVWQRRLWTFQESYLAKELHYQFSDGAQHFRVLNDDAKKYQADLRLQGRYVEFPSTSQGKATMEFVLLRSMVLNIKLGIQSTERTFSAFGPLRQGIGDRMTSRASDEVLCAATILGIDPTPFLQVRSKESQSLWSWLTSFWPRYAEHDTDRALAERRMELFMMYVGRFNDSIIFSRVPRLQRDGYRWAPRTLLQIRSADTRGQSRWASTINSSAMEAQMCQLGNGGTGLGVRFPGLKLGPVTSHLGIDIVIFVDGDAQYNLQLWPDENGAYPAWQGKLQYCLVLPKTLVDLGSGGVVAMLGSRRLKDSLELRYECCAWLEYRNEKIHGDVQGTSLPPETFWFIQ